MLVFPMLTPFPSSSLKPELGLGFSLEAFLVI